MRRGSAWPSWRPSTASGEALTTELELTPLLPIVGEKMREAFEADIAFIALLDEETRRHRLPVLRRGGRAEPQEPLPLRRGDDLPDHQDRETILMNTDERLEQSRDAWGRAARSFLGVPDPGGRQGHRGHQRPEHDAGEPLHRGRCAAAGDGRRQHRGRGPECPPLRGCPGGPPGGRAGERGEELASWRP